MIFWFIYCLFKYSKHDEIRLSLSLSSSFNDSHPIITSIEDTREEYRPGGLWWRRPPGSRSIHRSITSLTPHPLFQTFSPRFVVLWSKHSVPNAVACLSLSPSRELATVVSISIGPNGLTSVWRSTGNVDSDRRSEVACICVYIYIYVYTCVYRYFNSRCRCTISKGTTCICTHLSLSYIYIYVYVYV